MGFDVTSDLELWHVQLPTGVVTMSLDELDSAFQDGKIDESTMVLKSGGLHWMTLADIAGLDDAATPPPVSVSPYSQAPYSQPPYSQPPHSQAPYSQPPYSSQYSQPYGQYDGEPQPNSISPIAIDMGRPSALSIPPLPPVNFDVSFGTEEREIFKPKRSYGAVIGTLAAVAIIAGGLFAVKSVGLQGLKAKVASISSTAKNGDARSAAIAPPAAADPPPAFNPSAPPMNNAKAAPIEAPPPAAAAPAADKNGKQGKNGKDSSSKKTTTKAAAPAAAKKAGAKQSGSSDPTQKGSGQFDPLNGNI